MKAMMWKLLRLFGVDVLLLGLLEKLAACLTKKLAAFKAFLENCDELRD